MKTGIIEKVLMRRYGQPISAILRGLPVHGWNPDEWDYDTALYMGMKWNGFPGLRFASLKEVYGNTIGGYLIKNALKLGVLVPREIYGLWNIDDLRVQPELLHAAVLDPAIDYFMDENNVLFYGIKGDQLYKFDAETDELTCLGAIEQALEVILDDLEAAQQDVGKELG
jgi:hypothetical protein